MSTPIKTVTAKNFIGVWELESYTEYSGAEALLQPFGSNLESFPIYTDDEIVRHS